VYFHVLIPDLSLNICTWEMIFKSGGIQLGTRLKSFPIIAVVVGYVS
jgi:hypothetical protein